MPVLIVHLKPHGAFLACIVPSKGVHAWVAETLEKLNLECGRVQFSCRSDREPSICALFNEACQIAGRKGDDVTPKQDRPSEAVASSSMTFDMSSADVPAAEEESSSEPIVTPAVIGVPEPSHPCESQSNGIAEATAKSVNPSPNAQDGS